MALIDNLWSYWKLDGDSVDSIKGLNGTDTSIVYSNANGKINNGAGFNGTSSFIALPSYTNFNFNSQITINCWVNFVQSASEFFVDGWNRDGNAGWLIQEDSSNVYFQIYRGGVKTAYNARPANGWHMFTGVYDGSTVKIYIDGVAGTNSASTTGTFTPPNDYMTLGCYRYTDGTEQRTAFMSGSLDEVGIWSRGLSSTEITQLYNSGKGLQLPFQSSFLGIL